MPSRDLSPSRWAHILSTCFLLLCLLGIAEASPAPARGPVNNKKPPPPPEPYLKGQEPPGENFYQSWEYNDAAYGLYVNQTFKTSSVIAPRVNIMRPFTEKCDDGSLIFVTPRGEVVAPSPALLDLNGSLVWKPTEFYGNVYNFQVQHYKGEPYLAFWGGNSSVGGHGVGHVYMFDKHYQPFAKIDAINNLTADLHSFEILPNGNVLLTSYDIIEVTGRMPWKYTGQQYIWDSLFQEYNLESGELVFQWRASDFVPLDASWSKKPARPSYQKPWDWFHINQVEKDNKGNYLVSARHLRAILYVDGETGEVIWWLGGKRNSFTDLTAPKSLDFVGQHDAHWDENGKFITMFDNRADWEYEREHVSKGLRLEVDTERMTVRVNQSYEHPERIFGFSQGSYQTLPNGNVVLGYGYTAAMAEFSPDGHLLCDIYLEPLRRFSSGDAQSYRNLKFPWKGEPLTPPTALLEGNTVYVSWMGATEVRSWRVEHSKSEGKGFSAALETPKTGFETHIDLPEEIALRQYIRIVALDGKGEVLGMSAAIDLRDKGTVFTTASSDSSSILNGEDVSFPIDTSASSSAAATSEIAIDLDTTAPAAAVVLTDSTSTTTMADTSAPLLTLTDLLETAEALQLERENQELIFTFGIVLVFALIIILYLHRRIRGHRRRSSASASISRYHPASPRPETMAMSMNGNGQTTTSLWHRLISGSGRSSESSSPEMRRIRLNSEDSFLINGTMGREREEIEELSIGEPHHLHRGDHDRL